jgi:hypothetical protein
MGLSRPMAAHRKNKKWQKHSSAMKPRAKALRKLDELDREGKLSHKQKKLRAELAEQVYSGGEKKRQEGQRKQPELINQRGKKESEQ